MQVNETLSDGLKRGLSVTIPASELGTRLSARLEELKTRVNIKGFRPGKVPVNHLRRVYGKAAMAEIVETMVGEKTAEALSDRGARADERYARLLVRPLPKLHHAQVPHDRGVHGIGVLRVYTDARDVL